MPRKIAKLLPKRARNGKNASQRITNSFRKMSVSINRCINRGKHIYTQGWIQSSSSDFQKSLKCLQPAFVISQFLYCSSRNQLSFSFYYLLWDKTKKKASHLVIPSITQWTKPFLFVLCRYFREQREEIRWHDRRTFVPSGWDLMVYGSCHKSLKTHFDWPETLTLSCELLKVGCDWLFRPQTTVETTDNRI